MTNLPVCFNCKLETLKREVFLMNFCGFRVKGEGSYLNDNDRALSAESAKSTKETTQVTQNLELKKYIRAFCKDKLAPFKIPSKVSIVESLEVSERFKKLRLTNGGGG